MRHFDVASLVASQEGFSIKWWWWSRVPILDKLKINSRRFWRHCCLRPPFHPQMQSNRTQSGSGKSSENAFGSQIVIFAISRKQEARRWRASNGDEDHNSHKDDDDDDDLASCLSSAAVAPAAHAFDVSLLLMLRHLLPSGTLFSFLFFFFFLSFGLLFFRGFVLPEFCSSSWIGIRTASFWWEGFVNTFFVPTVSFWSEIWRDSTYCKSSLFSYFPDFCFFLSSLNYESSTLLALEFPGARKSLSYNTMCMKAILASRCNDE